MIAEEKSRSFVGHAATYAIGNIVRRVVGFAMLPIYTRFLSPADYGVIGLLTLVLSLFEPILGARLGAAIPKFYFDESDALRRRAVIWSALIFTAFASAVSVVALVLFRGVASDILFGNHRYAVALGLFAVTLLSQPIEQAGMTYLRLRQRSGLYLVFSLAKLVLQLALNLLLVVYWKEGVLGVVLSAVISSVILGIMGVIYVASYEPPAFDWHITKKMVQYCWPLWFSGLAGLYLGASGALYLRVFDSLSDVGRLELALRFSVTVGILIWAPFLQHWEPMSFQYYRQPDGKRKFQVAFVAISALMFVGGLGISIFSGPVIEVMAARPFYAAASVVPLLALGGIFDRLRSFCNFGFMVTGHTQVWGFCQYGSAAVMTVAYIALIPRFGLIGAATAQCVTYLGTFIYVYYLSRRYYDPEIKLAPVAVFSVIALGAYFCGDVLAASASALGVNLLIKSVTMVVATVLTGLVAIRSIRVIDISMFDSLPWPLHRLGRLELRRLLGS